MFALFLNFGLNFFKFLPPPPHTHTLQIKEKETYPLMNENVTVFFYLFSFRRDL